MRYSLLGIGILLSVQLPLHAESPSDVPTRMVPQLRADAAAKIIMAAEGDAAARGASVSICIIDDSGNMLRQARMDGASAMAIDYACRKAQTSLLFGATTASLANDPANSALIGQLPGLLFVAGGVPVRFGDSTIAAIGVSGSAAEVDDMIAHAGLGAISGNGN